MKVLHLTTVPRGGAGLACIRLHRALLNAGVNSKVLTLIGPEDAGRNIYSVEATDASFSKTIQQFKRKRYFQNWKVRLYGKTPELFSFSGSPWKIEDHPLVKEADIIHLHWVSGMIDIERFFRAVQKPIVWTLHDAWPYSGGFHYENYWNSGKFEALSRKERDIRRSAYSGHAIPVVAPSKYLLDQSAQSRVFEKASFHWVPNSAPADIFHPIEDRDAIRSHYGIQKDDVMWVFGSDELDYFRKGADLLIDAFLSWKTDRVQLVIAGKGDAAKLPVHPRIRFTGHIDSEDSMARLLGAADAVIHTSQEDNMPNVILEALLCGTPVLATPAGGVPEMIRTGENGLLTNDFSVASIRSGFDELLRTVFDRKKIAEDALTRYGDAKQVAKMLEVYRSA